MAHISFKLNGKAHLVDVDPECPLLYVLRDNAGLNNPRFGCGPAIAEAAARSLPTWSSPMPHEPSWLALNNGNPSGLTIGLGRPWTIEIR
jgi:hypothetical protein